MLSSFSPKHEQTRETSEAPQISSDFSSFWKVIKPKVETYSYTCRTDLGRNWWTQALRLGIYIYTFTSMPCLQRQNSHFSLAVCSLEHDAGSKVTPLIYRQVVLTRLPALLSSTIVGDHGTVTAISRKFAFLHTHTHTRIHTNAHIHTNPRTQSLTFAHNTLTLYLNFFFIFFLFSSPLLFQRVSLWSAFSFCVSLSFDPRCRRSKPLSPACVMCWLQERRPSLYCSRGAGAGHSYVNYSAVQTGSLHTYTPHNTPLTHSCHLCAYLNRNRPQMFDYAAMNLSCAHMRMISLPRWDIKPVRQGYLNIDTEWVLMVYRM